MDTIEALLHDVPLFEGLTPGEFELIAGCGSNAGPAAEPSQLCCDPFNLRSRPAGSRSQDSVGSGAIISCRCTPAWGPIAKAGKASSRSAETVLNYEQMWLKRVGRTFEDVDRRMYQKPSAEGFGRP